jgi:hypothetical protein
MKNIENSSLLMIQRIGEDYIMKELNYLHFSPNIVGVLKSRRMRWAEHVAGMGGETCTGFWWGT